MLLKGGFKMSEEKTTEQPNKNSNEGGKPKATSVLDEANSVKEELGKMLSEHRELLKRQEELMAQQMLRGKSSANVEDEKPKEETPKEYRDRIMSTSK